MLRCLVYTVRYMLSESQYVIVYVILYVMLYVIVYVIIYVMLYVILYVMLYVIVYVILYVMLYVIVYVMLYNLLTWLNLKGVFSKSHVYVTHGIVYLIFASKFHLLS